MITRYAILGAGRQGTAIAYSLASHFDASELRLVDSDAESAARAVERVKTLSKREVATAVTADAGDEESLRRAVRGCTAVVSALPYALNPGAARAAVAEGCHYTDLGGHTEIVRSELELDREAREAGVSLVPDSGIAPGFCNALAALALERQPETNQIRIWCGGLPAKPRGALRYKLTFNIAGLSNEYTGKAVVLRDGQRVELEAFTELEQLEFPAPIGRAEAFLTSGGTSTAPWSFEGSLETYEYKTVRYPGHYAMMRPLIDFGFLDTWPVQVGGFELAPRELTHKLLLPHVNQPGPDLLVLRLQAGTSSGQQLRFELLEFQDEATGFTAMERCTAYPTAALSRLQANNGVEPGARSLEVAFDPERYLELVRHTGISVQESRSG